MLTLLLLLHGASGDTMMKMLLPPDNTGGRCLDGSPAGYYFLPGADTKTWVISLAGGGACYTEDDCKHRALTGLGSSTKWPDTKQPGTGIDSFESTNCTLCFHLTHTCNCGVRYDVELQLCWASLYLCALPAERCGPDDPSLPILLPAAAPATVGLRTYYAAAQTEWPAGESSRREGLHGGGRPFLVAMQHGDISKRLPTVWTLDLSSASLPTVWSVGAASGVHGVGGVLLLRLFSPGRSPLLVAVRDEGAHGTLMWTRPVGGDGTGSVSAPLVADPRSPISLWVGAATHSGGRAHDGTGDGWAGAQVERLNAKTGELLEMRDLAALGLGRPLDSWVMYAPSAADRGVAAPPVLLAGFEGGGRRDSEGTSGGAAPLVAAVMLNTSHRGSWPVVWTAPLPADASPIGQLVVVDGDTRDQGRSTDLGGGAVVVLATTAGVVGIRVAVGSHGHGEKPIPK
jgi:hypothetical protein